MIYHIDLPLLGGFHSPWCQAPIWPTSSTSPPYAPPPRTSAACADSVKQGGAGFVSGWGKLQNHSFVYMGNNLGNNLGNIMEKWRYNWKS